VLYRFLGHPIPCVTVGRYSPKIAPWCEQRGLCDACKPIGECADKAYWRDLSNRGRA
jgi:hypothetical protein